MKTKLAIIAFNLTILCSSQAFAATFDQYVAFGDSTIDSGWWSGALSSPTPQCGAVSAPCETGNATKDGKISAAIANGGSGKPVGADGLMSSEILAADFGLTAKPANQAGGTNYAISGALSARVGGAPGAGNLNSNPNLPSTVEQIATYLSSVSNVANSNALYEIGSGGNDRTYANDNFNNLADKESFLSGQASSLATAIHVLQAAGAQTILVRGAPASTTLATYWTNTLFADLTALNVNFIAVNMAALVATVQANPTSYGFTAATVFPGVAGDPTSGSACVAGAGASGWGQWCANTTVSDPNGQYSRLRAANSEQTSFYSDNEHFSTAGQAIVANYEFGLVATPLPATLPLFASGLGALSLLCWRSKRTTKAAA